MPKSLTFEKVALRFSANKDAVRIFELLAETFKTLGDYSRVQIVWALSHGELCVGDIAELLSMSQSAVSHHLLLLKEAGFIDCRREGKNNFYRLVPKMAGEYLRQLFESPNHAKAKSETVASELQQV